MAETITTDAQAEPEYPIEQVSQPLSDLQRRGALGAILLISVFMNFYKLGQAGFTSYYPPAVRSMLDNWHNFFFAAYDPGGFSSLDKPPVGFWLQVLSAKIFGFTPISVLLPQALCGVLAVLLLYVLVRRQFGVVAGLLAALFLALSPISVVTNRTVQVDSTLALVLIGGAWAIQQAATTGRLRWLLLCAALLGIGFNVKMMEAYLVLPAFGLLYLLAAPLRFPKRLWHLALSLLLLLIISFSWAVAVDLTPTAQRPHVGSTQDDSEIGLSLGYNGIQRLLGVGSSNTPSSNSDSPESASPISAESSPSAAPQGTPSSSGSLPANPSGGPTNAGPVPTGNPSSADLYLFRLFTGSLAGQIGWLLPLALLGIIALVEIKRPRPRSDRKLQALLLWGTWLFTMGIFFSVAAFYHEYYLTVMAPAVAALCGIGLVKMWQDYRRPGIRGWLLPLAILTTVAEQVNILSGYPAWGQWMIPLLVTLCLLAVGVLILARLPLRLPAKISLPRFGQFALILALAGLMLGPTVWAAIPIFQDIEGIEPLAGPAGQLHVGLGPAEVDAALIRYLVANQGHTQILVAVSGVDTDKLILATNKVVMPLDGFSEYPLTTSGLASLIAQGKLRFVLMQPLPQSPSTSPQEDGSTGPVIGNSENSGEQFNGASAPSDLPTVLNWGIQHCKEVPSSQWQTTSSSSSSNTASGTANVKLYDCAAVH